MSNTEYVLNCLLRPGSLRMDKTAALEGVGDLTKAITYIVFGMTAAAGAGTGLILEKATEPTSTDIGNMQRAYAIANLKSNINSQMHKLHSDYIRTQSPETTKSIKIG